MLTPAVRFVVSHKAGNRRTGTGQNADNVADNPASQARGCNPPDVFTRQAEPVGDFRGLSAFDDLLFRQDQNLRHGKQADQSTCHVNAAEKSILTEHKAFDAFHRIHADCGNKKAQKA